MKTLRPFFIAILASAAAFVAIALAAGPGTQTSATTALDSEEQAFVTLINDYRAQNSKGPLLIDPSITAAARWMSTSMGQYNFFSHTDHLGQSPWTRMCNFGYCYSTYKGENIAAGYTTATAVINAWKNSSGHNANMLNANYRVMGIARMYTAGSTYGWYWTNDFGGYIVPAPSTATPTPTQAPPPAPTNTPAPTATPSPTKSPTPVPTAAPTAAPTASPTPAPPVAPACAGDNDCDGFSNTFETYLGTDQNKHCAVTATKLDESPQPFPPDFDDNGRVDVSDVLGFRLTMGTDAARHDLTGNGSVDIGDVIALKQHFGHSC